MKFKKVSVFILAAISAVSLAACSGESDQEAISGAALPHYNGVENAEEYDSDVFYRNDLTVFGGDCDVIWVSEEQDPVNGGYFYQYTSGNFLVTQWLEEEQSFGVSCLRSKDLNDWELCGAVDNGFAIRLYRDDWVKSDLWAPEVIYDEVTEHYYMYLSAKGWAEDARHPNPDYHTVNFHFAIFASETPQGPFTLLTSEDYYEWEYEAVGTEIRTNDAGETINRNDEFIGTKKPQIDVAGRYELDHFWGAIDMSPFIDYDENGERHIYLYFSKHWGTHGDYRYPVLSIWGMEMKDFLTPNYDSMRMIAYPDYQSVEYKGGPVYEDSSYELIGYEGDYEEDDGDLVEGAQILAHTSADGKKRYYLTYSQTGYAARDYGCHQAVSEGGPLGSYKKLTRAKSALGVTNTNDYMTGVGHHAYVEFGEGEDYELYNIYWVHADPFNTQTSGNNGRAYAFDKTVYTYDPALGYDILYGNGPSKSLQALPAMVSGYKNVVKNAKISVSKGEKSTLSWLTDGCFTVLDYFADREFKTNGKTTITLTFDTPQTVRAVMLFNSIDYQYAFSQVDSIVFKLAEKPAWYTADAYNGYVYIKDLPFNSDYYNAEDEFMRHGGSAHASFNEISVSEIQITVSKTLSGGGEIRLSELYVLGK